MGHGEAVVGNSATYALMIHEGRTYTSGRSGGSMNTGRPFLTDAAQAMLGGGKILAIAEKRLAEGIKKHGLG